MSIQVTCQNNRTTIVCAPIPEESLVKENGPLFSFINNITKLFCNQVNNEYMTVRKAFFNAIQKIGNTTKDLDNGGIIILSEYIKTKKINILVNQALPEDKQAMVKAIKKGVMGLVALSIARESHYAHHRGDNIDTCKEQVELFSHLVNQRHLTEAKKFMETTDFNTLPFDISSLASSLLNTIKKSVKVVDGTALQIMQPKNTRTQRHIQTHKEEFKQKSDLFRGFFIDLIDSEQVLSTLLKHSLDPGKNTNIVDTITQIVKEEKEKRAKAIGDQLVKEEKKEKQFRKKPYQKRTNTSYKSSSSSFLPPSDVKKTLPETTSQPKNITEQSDLDLLKKLNHIIIKKLTLHPRIKRWVTTTPDTIKDIEDWDEKEKRWIHPYEKDLSPDYTIASHDLSSIIRLLRSPLANTYAKRYSFIDTENKKRKGWAMLVDMQFQNKEYKGTIFAAVGEGNVLYHAHFTQFSASSKNPMIQMLSEQLKEMVKDDKSGKTAEKNSTEEWETQGTFSVKRDNQEKDILLTMNNATRETTFVFYPLH